METFISIGRKFYATCIAALGVQQLFYLNFRPVFAPDSTWLRGLPIVVILFSTFLILSGAALLVERNTKTVALMLGTVFLVLFLGYHVPHLLFVNPYGRIFGSWVNALKELAFAGGAFVIAQSYGAGNKSIPKALSHMESIAPLGRIFFSVTMLLFGITHFVYTDFAARLVPHWIPGAYLWTYLSGAALVGSGAGIMINLKVKEIGLMLGTMIFIWLIILHIPRAIGDPSGNEGNELTSAFQALGFSGIAFILAGKANSHTP